MFANLPVLMDVLFPYLRFPSPIMIIILISLLSYIVLNIKSSLDKSHYAVMGAVLFLCVFQATPVSDNRQDKQLDDIENILHEVKTHPNFTKEVHDYAEKLTRYSHAMKKKGYLNFSNLNTLNAIQDKLESAIKSNRRFNPLVNTDAIVAQPTVVPYYEDKKVKAKPQPDFVKLEEVKTEEPIQVDQSASSEAQYTQADEEQESEPEMVQDYPIEPIQKISTQDEVDAFIQNIPE